MTFDSVLSPARKIVRLASKPQALDLPAEPERVQIHWLVTSGLLSGAMWAVLIAVIMAIAGAGAKAGYPLIVAAGLLWLLWMCVRKARPRR